MFTDPDHLKVTDPGKVEGNVVFTYLDAFDDDKNMLFDLKNHYKQGGLGDSIVKKRLLEILESKLAPIREKRLQLNNDHEFVMSILKNGTDIANQVTQETLIMIKKRLGIFSFT